MTQVKKDIRYLNKDFSQFRANLIEFGKNYYPNTYKDYDKEKSRLSAGNKGDS